MGKYHFYFPVTWTLEHATFQLLQQLNPKSSFTSLWLKIFVWVAKYLVRSLVQSLSPKPHATFTAGLQIIYTGDLAYFRAKNYSSTVLKLEPMFMESSTM